VPFHPIFVGLLAAYLIASMWAGLDSRHSILPALLVMVAAVFLAIAGKGESANTLSGFVFLLRAAGIVLLAVDSLQPVLGTSPTRQVPEIVLTPEVGERERSRNR
jgi:hypothetical protein